MNCLDCQTLLQLFLDGDWSPDQADYNRHLGGCADCRERHAAAQLVLQALTRQPAAVSPEGLRDAIVGRVLTEGRHRLAFRRRMLTGAAMAAGILVALFLSNYPFQKAELGGRPVAVVQHPVPPPSVNQAVGEAGQALASLLNRTAGETIDQGKLLLPDMGETPHLADTRVIEAAWTPTARSLEEAGRGVSSGLEPVTTSARRALNLFMKEIPAVDRQAKPGL